MILTLCPAEVTNYVQYSKKHVTVNEIHYFQCVFVMTPLSWKKYVYDVVLTADKDFPSVK